MKIQFLNTTDTRKIIKILFNNTYFFYIDVRVKS